jgi:flagella synthesis protein FlgN
MHDTNLLQLINDDFAPAQQLLELLQTESLALHGRDMPLLEEILATKQALIILLEQHGRKRSEILASLNLPTDRTGLEQLASQSSIGDQLLTQGDALTTPAGPLPNRSSRERSARHEPFAGPALSTCATCWQNTGQS